MHSLNILLRKRVSTGSLVVAGLFSIASGCQGPQLSWVGAHNGNKPIVTRLDEVVPTEKSIGPVEKRGPLQLASASDGVAGANALGSAQQAVFNESNGHPGVGSPAQVIPTQYTTTPKYAPIGRSPGSENVPRIAMGTQIMVMPPIAGPPSAGPPSAGPPSARPPQRQSAFSTAGHVQGHSHADGKCNCGGSGVYKPLFPRLSGNSSCQGCGSTSCFGGCGNAMVEQGFAVPRTSDAQEYIFDGGDHDPKVRLREDLSQVGLDAEDTVIQYETADGKTNVESGCRVAIYAPRFASVRKRQSTQERDFALRAQATLRPDGPGVFRDQLPPVNVSKPVKSSNSDNVRVVDAYRERSRVMPAERVQPMLTVSDAFKPYEDLSLIRNGDFRSTDLARLAKATAAARSWTSVDELHVLIDGQEAIDVTGSKKAADVTIYEFKGARIRLCKVASDQMANPGDVISFTIRFDNVGEQPLKNLVVTDSLAPRLEYVDKSQQASVAADFSIVPNSVGSSVLRWELENGLKPGDGGLVRFSCKVR